MAEIAWQEEYNGHKVGLVGRRFAILTLDPVESFDSWDQAKTRIDRIVANESKRAREKMSIAVIRGDGLPFTITGLHASSGKPLGIELKSQWGTYGSDSDRMYIDCPEVKTLLDLRNEAREHLEEIDRKLTEFRVDYYRSYGNCNYDDALAKFKAAVEKAKSAVGKEER